MISELARTKPDGLALDDGTRRRSWAALHDRTARFARFFRETCGLGPDDHAALLIGNRVEGIEAILGAIHAGIWLTPVNWHLGPDEVAYVLRDSGARIVVCDDEHAPTARASGCQTIRAGDELDGALAAASDEPMPLGGRAGGNMIYTSGTTGRPKGVKRARAETLGRALEAQQAYARSIACDGSGPHLVTGPLYHAAPLMFAVYDQACGAPVIVMPRWDERACLALLAEREVHHTHLVPTMFVRLLERLPEDERQRFSAPALHTVLHGAAPVSKPVKQRMIDWWGPILYEYWGGTEGGVTTFSDSHAWLAHPGTVGRCLPHYEVFAADQHGRRLSAGEEGDLYARHASTPALFEYHGDPAKTAAAFLDPYTHTLGDVGRVDAEGYVYLMDRRSHTIISGGVNIYPVEIEQVLQEHPAVADVAVFGVPDDEWGEQVKAVVEPARGATPGPTLEAELIAFARERLAHFKAPRSVDFSAALPRTPAGKIQIRHLRAPYWEDRERRI